MKKDVMLSGGIDSLVCAEMARETGELVGCVFVEYGQPAQAPERCKAVAFCGQRGLALTVLHVSGLNLGGMADESGARVVPARNAILLALAANTAHGMGWDCLVIGANADDSRDYEDCRPPFLVGAAAHLGIAVAAPLLGLAKEDAIRAATRFGLTRDDAWSCYRGGPLECRECPSCLESAKGWSSTQQERLAL